ncbi:hypothetical protein MG293_015536 [Ovis ammon polii]|uniref:Uncharacterized protein n=1 Tax=Ovis ammon polii TaxID=230172 RepID=A0AAD4TXP0_OVIAM|nr:hypothetical protein MG293_015536 [Ovis ammon polii]KAI4558456.1 hypothetical protein MJT46_013098 [Ovis ammon polii x Ovis aries]
MHQHCTVHFAKGALPPRIATERYFLDPELGHRKDILTEDDVYCSCLAKTLCHVPVPVTVGFYAPFGCRLHMMLDKITARAQGRAPTRPQTALLTENTSRFKPCCSSAPSPSHRQRNRR